MHPRMDAAQERRFGLHTGVPVTEIPQIDVRCFHKKILGQRGGGQGVI